MEKISTSGSASFWLFVTLTAIWAVIQLLILLVTSEAYLLPGTIVFLFVSLISLNSFVGNVKMNDCHVLLNYFTKKRRAVFEGFYFKLPWESIEFIVNLEAIIHAKVRGTFPTIDGSMEIEAAIMSKPDSAAGASEKKRSERMINYVRYTQEAINSMQTAVAEKTIREKVKDETCTNVKSFTHEQILKKKDFDEVAKELSIIVIECPIKDVDYNEEVQRARNAASKANAVKEMVETLKKAGYSDKEARTLAPLLDKDISLTKEIKEIVLGGEAKLNLEGIEISPEVVKAITLLIEKFGGKK
ncbi:MAG TPA: hypothetical protein PLO44_00615 [Candidatus Paceibacterota bacterium]|nr:hypothetical protein [Candidatus Paceibacterota bacterium]